MVEKETLPLIVTDTSGKVVAVSLMNRKAYGKSLERGRLWHVHGETGRVLPLEIDGIMKSVRAGEGWFSAVISSEGPGTSKSDTDIIPEEKSVISSDGVLAELARVISDRKRLMPDGSYTTHLFASGPDKIRKKLGEEAVEVILAGSRQEITSEAADLIYHLLVFLEEAGVPLEDVLEELRRRR